VLSLIVLISLRYSPFFFILNASFRFSCLSRGKNNCCRVIFFSALGIHLTL
jgi:hypothetical protein